MTDLAKLAEQQQTMIKQLLDFNMSTAEALQGVTAGLLELQGSITDLEEAQEKLHELGTTFLNEHEIDFRDTKGGTG